MKIISKSGTQTKKIAARLAHKILKAKSSRSVGRGSPQEAANLKARVIALVGDLGAGKTTFAQGFAKSLGVRNRIVSPTFLIFRSYKLKVLSYKFFFHVDLYRVSEPRELDILKFKDILNSPSNIVLIEWAEKIRKILPKDTIWVNFQHGAKENERRIEIFS